MMLQVMQVCCHSTSKCKEREKLVLISYRYRVHVQYCSITGVMEWSFQELLRKE